MKIIFLDIDGVLNSDLWYRSQQAEVRKSNVLELHLDPRAIQLLNKVILETGAKVVLSSTWRKHYLLETIQSIFESMGFIGEIISKTPDLVRLDENFIRGNEILKWCKDNELLLNCKYYQYTEYVILDDKNDVLFWHKNNFIQLDRYSGITPTKASEAIKLLGRVPKVG